MLFRSSVTVVRGGKETPLKVTLGRLEDGEKQAALDAGKSGGADARNNVQKALGLEFGALTAETRKRFNFKDGAEGVLVTSVEPGSQAAERRSQAGDRILEINQDAVSKPEDVARKIKELNLDL